jgi:hypothetical protein
MAVIISVRCAFGRNSSRDDHGRDRFRVGGLPGTGYVVQIMIRVLLLRGRDEAR